MESNHLPAGFKGAHAVSQLKHEFLHIHPIKWECPPRFILSHNWRVATGEENEEAQAQRLRELELLEAVYAHPSSIPSSPSVSSDDEKCHHDCHHTPLIPLSPIEEDAMLAPSEISQVSALARCSLASEHPVSLQCNSLALNPHATEKPVPRRLQNLEADTSAAASAVFTIIMKSKEQGSLIDTNLLIKILSNPKMIEKLINADKPPANRETAPLSAAPKPVAPSICMSNQENGMLSAPRRANWNLNHVLKEVPPTSTMHSQQPASTEASPVLQSKPVTVPVLLSNLQPDPVLPRIQANDNLRQAPNGMSSSSARMPPQPSYLGTAPCSVGKLFSLPDSLATFETDSVLSPGIASANLYSQSAGVHAQRDVPIFTPAVKSSVLKDVIYYKSLVRQHGGDEQEATIQQYGSLHDYSQDQKLVLNSKTSELKPEIQKPCAVFNNMNGHRNESCCLFNASTGPSPVLQSKPVSVPVLLSSLQPDPVLPRMQANDNLRHAPNGMSFSSARMPPLPAYLGTASISVVNPFFLPYSLSNFEPDSVLSLSLASANLHSRSARVHAQGAVPMFTSAVKSSVPKDAIYQKSLVWQHGGDDQEATIQQYGCLHDYSQDRKPVLNSKHSELKPEIQNPCVFFNNINGCRNGSDCPFEHAGGQSGKRRRL